ncbi:MAG: hypothetical protein JNM72_21665 [Deltaproteobacteria bacterium]|nr:hypothetical protein [Deltaproteobacteria bacterium]
MPRPNHPSPALRCAALLALGACAAPGAAGSKAEGGAGAAELAAADSAAAFVLEGEPTAYAPALADADPPAPLAAAAVADGLQRLIDHLHALDPLVHHDAYTAMFWGYADPENGCPEMGEHNGMDLWRDECETWSGARFDGFNLNVRAGGWVDGPLSVLTYDWVTGHSTITSPEGVFFQSFGDVDLRVADHSGGFRVWDGFVFGDFVWEDPSAAGTWVQQPTSHEVYFLYERHSAHRTARLDGSLTQLEGPILAATFAGLSLSSATGACAAEPSGSLDLRDTEGRWYTLGLGDGVCDGCARYSLDGVELGEVCADWSALTTWESWPWARE